MTLERILRLPPFKQLAAANVNKGTLEFGMKAADKAVFSTWPKEPVTPDSKPL